MTYPYPMPKSRTIIRLHSHLSAGLAPHGISCHYKSDKQLFYNALIRCNFAPSEYDKGKNALRRNRHAANVAQQSDDRRILCSNEQSKLCFSPTKSLLSDRNRLALPHGRGNFSKVGIPAEKTGNENFKGNETRHRKKNGKKTQE